MFPESHEVKSVVINPNTVQQVRVTRNKTNVFFPSVGCIDKTAMPPPADIVKVAIEWPGANAQLIEMDQVCVCINRDIKYISSLPLITQTSSSCKWLNL